MALAPHITSDGAGAYRFDRTYSAAETVKFTFIWDLADGSDFPWADVTVEYVVGNDAGVSLTSSPVNGITIDTDANSISFDVADPFALATGQYPHECRIIETATGDKEAVFSGYLTIAETPFTA